MTLPRLPLLLLCGSTLASLPATADEIRPDQIQFRRQAATRMIFDAAQNIPLASLRPAKVVDLDLMHPELRPDSGIPLPEGYPAPYIALMMDRANFPGMPKSNWTYGALYLYHGHLPER